MSGSGPQDETGHAQIGKANGTVIQGPDSPSSYGGHGEPPQTASSYSGIFNRMGLPLPRSARVKVDYELVQKDPKISEQLRAIVHSKDVKGQRVMAEGRRDNLITERTYELNRKRLEKWVSASYNKLENNERPRSTRRLKAPSHEELIQAALDGRMRLQKIISITEGDRQSAHSATGRGGGVQSGRQYSHMSQSGRAGQTLAGPVHGRYDILQDPSYHGGALSSKAENYTDRDPYGRGSSGPVANGNNVAIGSGRPHRSKLVDLINGDTSRREGRPQREASGSDSRKNPGESSSYGGQPDPILDEPTKVDDIHLQIDDPKDRGGPRRPGGADRDPRRNLGPYADEQDPFREVVSEDAGDQAKH